MTTTTQAISRDGTPDLEFEHGPCFLCGSMDFRLLARHDRHSLGIRTVGCRVCGLIQTSPRPTASSVEVFYKHHYHRFYQAILEPTALYIAQHKKAERLRYTASYLSEWISFEPESKLLDYGCAEGSLFVALRSAGFRGALFGIEPDPAFARFAADNGRATVVPSLDALPDLNAVVFNHVLEHLLDPVGTLRSVRARLASGAVLYLDVPDPETYDSPKDLHIAHLAHYSVRTLARLVQRAGFRVLLCEKHAPPHHPRSVRLIATPDSGATESSTTPESEGQVWGTLDRVERSAWMWVVPLRLARVPVLRAIYRRLRAAWTRVRGRGA